MSEHLRRITSKETADHYCGKTIQNELMNLMAKQVINTIIDQCKDLDIDNCRGQGYDNGANMAGKKNGVQANILRKNLRAIFVPCGCHNLNLVVADAARSNQCSKDLFGIIQCIYNVFSGSAKRWKILSDHVSSFTVKPLCTTRWECRINCIKPLKYNIGGIQEALFALAEDPSTEPKTSHEAQTLSQQIVEFEFIVALIVWYDLLFQINIVSKAIQYESADLISATHLIKKTYEFLKNFRETGFESSLKAAKKLAEDNGVEPVFKKNSRILIKKTFFDYEGKHQPVAEPIQKFRANFFNVLVDTATNSLEERFQQMEIHNQIWGLLYNIKSLPTRDELQKSCLQLQTSLTSGSACDINGAELADEFRLIQTLLPEETVTLMQILNFVTKNGLTDTFSNMWIALRILQTIPVSVASGERSFSKLKLIKTYLRSTMSEERLSSLAVLSIENHLLNSIDLNSVIDEFARVKARRVVF
ncbi:zinc finger MYM-type protein 1-like [Rhinoderma darwinii]|uniref:zinc finger MYM-type protein 1-like n=1 Tax=Rhinoderma darwinii TaxID=43563 RepID=UPI003F66FBFE